MSLPSSLKYYIGATLTEIRTCLLLYTTWPVSSAGYIATNQSCGSYEMSVQSPFIDELYS